MSTNKNELRLVVDTFKFYYIRVSKIENFIFKINDSRVVMINNFIEDFKVMNETKILQEKSLKKFFDFQFNYWYRKDSKYGKGVGIQIEWIIGKQAVERWKKANKKHLTFIVSKNLKADNDFKIKGIQKENWRELIINVSPTEEIIKSKFINEEIGFELCSLNTNLYNHKSLNCMVCLFSEKCKETLKILYPKIYQIRGY